MKSTKLKRLLSKVLVSFLAVLMVAGYFSPMAEVVGAPVTIEASETAPDLVDTIESDATDVIAPSYVQIEPTNIAGYTISIAGALIIGDNVQANAARNGVSIHNAQGNLPAGYSIHWQRRNPQTGSWIGVGSPNNNLRTWRLTSTHDGWDLRVQLRRTYGGGQQTVATSIVAGPVHHPLSVSINGTMAVGSTLTASVTAASASRPSGMFFVWETRTPGGTWVQRQNSSSSSFALQPAHRGHEVRVSVRAVPPTMVIWIEHASANRGAAVVTQAVTSINHTGTLTVGSILTANTTPAGATGTFVWERSANGSTGWTEFARGTTNTRTLTTAERGQHIRVRLISPTNGWTGTPTSNPRGPITQAVTATSHTGALTVGGTLTANSTPAGATGTWVWEHSANGSTWTSFGSTTSTTSPAIPAAARNHHVRVRLTNPTNGWTLAASPVWNARSPITQAVTQITLPATVTVGNQITATTTPAGATGTFIFET
ncbi:MAG: hypothetical protein FWE21_10515, partial [Defluviitaleaceae bacterium]|nr:hypothetical protein [Defluviitaleaceae bacterium]